MAKETPARRLRSGELAAMTGVSRDALRYYERRHLLQRAHVLGLAFSFVARLASAAADHIT